MHKPGPLPPWWGRPGQVTSDLCGSQELPLSRPLGAGCSRSCCSLLWVMLGGGGVCLTPPPVPTHPVLFGPHPRTLTCRQDTQEFTQTLPPVCCARQTATSLLAAVSPKKPLARRADGRRGSGWKHSQWDDELRA